MDNSFDRLLNQVDAFIRKYYTNELIKGIIFFFGLFLLSYLFVSILEYLGRFNSLIRGIFLFGFILFNLYVLVRYIIIPFAKLYSFGSRINRVQASEIIGSFFPSISDRLKNTLQLNDLLLTHDGNLELLSATINQRSEQLNTIPFTGAIKIKDNKKYLKFIVPLLLVLFALIIFIPSLLTQGTERVINFNEEFKPLAPFKFIVNTNRLLVEEGNDVEVILTLKGSFLPDNVYINCVNGKFIMTKNAKNAFSAIIKKPKNSASFSFTANEFESQMFNYKVLGKSVVSKLDAAIYYPTYLGKKNIIINNSGDLTVPEGTKIEWSILTKNTKSTRVCYNNENTEYNDNGFVISKIIKNNALLSLNLKNQYSPKIDSTSIHITVIKDAFPTIVLSESIDSLSDGVRFFQGNVGDDYGLKSLRFVYTLTNSKGVKKTTFINVKPVNGTRAYFDFAVDFRKENVQLDDRIDYYFTVSDNDGVNGSKSTKSNVSTYKLPSLEQLNEQRGEDQQKNKDDLAKLLKETKDFQKNVDKLKKDILNSKSNDWNKVNKATQLKEDQKKLVESLENLKSEMNQSTQEKNQLSEINKEITDKQDLIEKLLEELMDDELKKLLEELEELMKQNNKEELKDKMDQISQSAEDMKKQLDRSLEMLKKLQINEKIDDAEKELKKLASDQEELKKQIEDKKTSKTDASDKQDALNKKFDNIKKELEEIKELNKALDSPIPLTETNSLEEKISEGLNDAKESLDQGKEKKAGDNQKSAADDMNELADQLDQSQQEANKQEAEEDMEAIRNILESLMTLSFNQELLISKFKKINPTNPIYKKYGRLQREIVTDTEIVRDSLLALAKRQAKIASFIDKELNAIKDNHELAINSIDDHRVKDLEKYQQLTMTSYNNLALLLNEALQQMQSDMQSQQKGSGSCSKPGNGKPKPGSMSSGDMKEMLKKQLEKLKKGSSPGEAKEGDKPGNKPGDKPGGSMPGLGNKEIAKMAAEQTAMRQRLEQMRNELNKDGNGLGNKLSPLIKELEEQEKALINKRSNTDLVKRQQEILSRLLESEKALMERGFEEKRESKSGQNDLNGNKIRFDEYNKIKLKQIDLIQTVDPSFNKYYKDKANQFFNLFE
jgi:hypothetical protein